MYFSRSHYYAVHDRSLNCGTSWISIYVFQNLNNHDLSLLPFTTYKLCLLSVAEHYHEQTHGLKTLLIYNHSYIQNNLN